MLNANFKESAHEIMLLTLYSLVPVIVCILHPCAPCIMYHVESGCNVLYIRGQVGGRDSIV